MPHNIETFEKEKLYTETISLKKQRNDVLQQCTLLKTNLKAAEADMRKKDAIIAQLTQEIKMQANAQSQANIYPYGSSNSMLNQNSFINTPIELQALTSMYGNSSGVVGVRSQK